MTSLNLNIFNLNRIECCTKCENFDSNHKISENFFQIREVIWTIFQWKWYFKSNSIVRLVICYNKYLITNTNIYFLSRSYNNEKRKKWSAFFPRSPTFSKLIFALVLQSKHLLLLCILLERWNFHWIMMMVNFDYASMKIACTY